ncbi:MAG: hypothetical protein KDE54_23890 [Caldilineaceae bacterium]|nr:hypothetical protein [Caldilineaceae bacterium]MCB0139712.1 hypothetical protein [Caldilineaceae bacterium]MCB9150327.1 hypothetical protein [Caldilineaceae bacterium]MCB9157057.1 hypothetical protein [Caldilineaceae bacterium]
MIANRRTFTAKNGQSDAALDLLKIEARTMSWPHGLRMYSSSISQFSLVSFEAEFDTLAQYETFWHEWNSRSTTPAFMAQWWQLVESGGKNEIFTVDVIK